MHVFKHFCITTHKTTLFDVWIKIVHVFSFTNSQSEEDKQLQEDLEMMVERLSVSFCLSIFSSVCRSRKHTDVSLFTYRKRTQLCTILRWKSCAGRSAPRLLL